MKKIIAFLALSMTIACAPVTVSNNSLVVPNYDQYGITRINVNEIQIVNAFVPSYAAPNVEHQFYVPPYSAIRDWGLKRFQAVGNIGLAKLNILDASVVRRDMAIKDGAAGWFYDQVNAEYQMNVLVRLEIISPHYENMPFAEVRATRKLETTEGMTLTQRDAALNKMVVDMLGDLDRTMSQSIQKNLASAIQ
jgi:hypothetical protein